MRRLKLDPKLIKRIRNLKLDAKLTERICPPARPPKPKVTPQFKALCLAWLASHDLRAFAGTIRGAAFARNKLFFHYLAKYLKNKMKRLPISEEQRKLLQLISQKPHLSAEEALKELGWAGGTVNYGVTKQRAISRSILMAVAWEEGWLEDSLADKG